MNRMVLTAALAAMMSATNASASCLVIGDSLAVGVGRQMPECRTVARSGISSQAYLARPLEQYREDFIVVSLGVNDGPHANEHALRVLRSRLTASRVIWLAPNRHSIHVSVAQIAHSYGDPVLSLTKPSRLSSDRLHLTARGYRETADEIRALTAR